MRDLHLLRALKEGGHKWNPGVKCDSRGAALEGDIFLASRAAREDQDDFAEGRSARFSLSTPPTSRAERPG